MRFRGDHVSLEPRKENPVVFLKSHSSRSEDNLWFGLSVDSERQEKFIRKIRHNIWDDRTAEVYDRNGELWLHQVLQREVPVVEDDSVETVIGVDPGEVMLSTVSVVPVDDPDSPVVDHMTSGGPFRERREQRNAYRKRLQKNKGNGAKLKEQKDKQLRDTEQFLHEESVRVVEAAAEHYPAAIALEDLTGYREKAQNPIHDWPYAMFRNMIEYKAEKAGIPVKTIDPHNTSVECRECGFASQDNREDRDEFLCQSCGYEVHADVNAAFNIGQRGVEKLS